MREVLRPSLGGCGGGIESSSIASIFRPYDPPVFDLDLITRLFESGLYTSASFNQQENILTSRANLALPEELYLCISRNMQVERRGNQ